MAKWQGSKWIRQDRRLAIYLRDGMQCVYCQSVLEDGIVLSLDHLTPRSQTEVNDNSNGNLVTCCRKCNSARGDRDYKQFAHDTAVYLNHGVTGQQIVDFIETTRNRPIAKYRKMAKKLIKNRSTFGQVLELANEGK